MAEVYNGHIFVNQNLAKIANNKQSGMSADEQKTALSFRDLLGRFNHMPEHLAVFISNTIKDSTGVKGTSPFTGRAIDWSLLSDYTHGGSSTFVGTGKSSYAPKKDKIYIYFDTPNNAKNTGRTANNATRTILTGKTKSNYYNVLRLKVADETVYFTTSEPSVMNMLASYGSHKSMSVSYMRQSNNAGSMPFKDLNSFASDLFCVACIITALNRTITSCPPEGQINMPASRAYIRKFLNTYVGHVESLISIAGSFNIYIVKKAYVHSYDCKSGNPNTCYISYKKTLNRTDNKYRGSQLTVFDVKTEASASNKDAEDAIMDGVNGIGTSKATNENRRLISGHFIPNKPSSGSPNGDIRSKTDPKKSDEEKEEKGETGASDTTTTPPPPDYSQYSLGGKVNVDDFYSKDFPKRNKSGGWFSSNQSTSYMRLSTKYGVPNKTADSKQAKSHPYQKAIQQIIQPLATYGIAGMPASYLPTTDPPLWYGKKKNDAASERYGMGYMYSQHYIKYGSYIAFRPCEAKYAFAQSIGEALTEGTLSGISAPGAILKKIQSGDITHLFGRTREYWQQVSRMCRTAIWMMGIQDETFRFITGSVTTAGSASDEATSQGITYSNGNEFTFKNMRAPAWMAIGTTFSNFVANNYTYFGTNAENTPRIPTIKTWVTDDAYEASRDQESSASGWGEVVIDKHPTQSTGTTGSTGGDTSSSGGNASNGTDTGGTGGSSNTGGGSLTPPDAGADDGTIPETEWRGTLDYGTVAFMTDGPIDVTERHSNATAPSAVSQLLSKISGGGQGEDNMVGSLVKGFYGTHGSTEGWTSWLTGSLMQNKTWTGTETQRQYSVSMQFVSPYGDPVCVFLNVLYPLIKLYALSLPESTGGLLFSPWIVNVYSNSGINIDFGMISDVTVTKNLINMNDWNMPTEVKVQANIEDLKPYTFMEKPKFWSFASKQSGSVTTLIATLAGRNVTTISYDDKYQIKKLLGTLNYAEQKDGDMRSLSIGIRRFGLGFYRLYDGVVKTVGDKIDSAGYAAQGWFGSGAYDAALDYYSR